MYKISEFNTILYIGPYRFCYITSELCWSLFLNEPRILFTFELDKNVVRGWVKWVLIKYLNNTNLEFTPI